jgi:hypothetical protein
VKDPIEVEELISSINNEVNGVQKTSTNGIHSTEKDNVREHVEQHFNLSNPEEIDIILNRIKNRDFSNSENSVSAFQYSGFWTNNHKNTEIQLSLGLLADFLTVGGWRVLGSEILYVSNGIVSKKTKHELYEFLIILVSYKEAVFKVKDITITVDKTTLKTKAQKEIRGNTQMLALTAFEFKIKRDTAQEIFFHFSNCSMKITKTEITLYERKADEGVVWEDQLLKHEIKEDDGTKSVFSDFIRNVSGPENYRSFVSAIGRSLQNYNGSDGFRIPWFCDAKHNAGESNGRTGKSLITKAIGRCRKLDACHGKDFRADNTFKFQNVDLSTQVYCIDDVKDNFDFKALYNIPSEGMEYEQKNKDRKRLSIHETPQLLITSNHTPQIEQGASTTGRLLILPVQSFYQQYAEKGGIKAYHDHVFFDDWNSEEWNRFYWFMAKCAKYYLEEGYIYADQTEIRKNRLRDICSKKLKSNELADEFVDFIYKKDPKEFTIEELKTEFENESIDNQSFATCIKNYYAIENKKFTKQRERIAGFQKTIWRVI